MQFRVCVASRKSFCTWKTQQLSQNITICLKLIYLLKKYVKIYIYIYVLEVCGWFLFGLYANLSQVIWVPYYRKWFQLNWKDGRLRFFFSFVFLEIYGELMGVGCHAYFIPNPQQILSELKSWHNYCFTQFILA